MLKLAHKEDFEGLAPAITEQELQTVCEHDPTLIKLLDAMLEYSVRYALDVWSMQEFIHDKKFDTEDGAREFAEMDDARTRLHTTLVDSIAILSRALGKNGLNNEWVRELSNGVGLGRAECGAFALLLTYRRYLDNL